MTSRGKPYAGGAGPRFWGDEVIRRYIDEKKISGAVTLVARRGRVVHHEARGVIDVDSKAAVTAEALRAAVRRVLSDESYRQQAAQVGESFRAAGGVHRAADAIVAFTRGSRPPRDHTAASPTLQP